PEQAHRRPDRVGGVDDDHIVLALHLFHVLDAVADDDVDPGVVEAGAQLGHILPAQGDHPLVDLHKVDALDAGVLHHFPHGAAVAAANDQDPARVRMAHERHVRDHLVIHELVLDRRLHAAVQNQHAAEAWRVDDRDVLIAAPFPVQHTADADADIQVIGFDLLQPKLQPSDLLFLLTGYIRYIPPVSCPQGKTPLYKAPGAC